RRFCAGPGALIPRPETAELVGHIVRAVSETPGGESRNGLSVLDIGTGSGCIALSLALEIPGAEVTAWDISPEALAVARRNGALYPEAKVTFSRADILSPPATGQCWDIIVSNPPYVRQCEARDMERNVLEHEPHTALFVPDDDPLLFYRAVADFARSHLTAGGWLWFEINQYLSSETARLIEDFGFRDVQIQEDGFGLPRFVQGRMAD
ncbi:MAG: peptide chain release factor N(5)-glutamine methyltransferase, partial [Bacteroidaceae bacterium]|nr:peptide chain release factor N(5)-glutamine methyltransferase [Bacteroidaceae bacterium]